MTDYLLDTNHVSPLVTPRHPLRDRVLSALRKGSRFAVCVPVIAETLFGLGGLPRAERNLTTWKTLRSNFDCFIPDESDAEAAATLRIALRRRGWQLGTVDAFIAVIALRYDQVLLTTDKDFLGVPGLRSENWRPQ